MSAAPTLTPAAESLAAAFAPRDEAPWLAEARVRALARFRAAGLPTVKQEDWRFTNLAPLAALRLERPHPDEGEAAAALLARAGEWNGPQLVFANGRYRSDLSSADGLPPGAVLLSLAEALDEVPDLVRPHLGRLARPEAHPLSALSAALFDDGLFLHLPSGAAVAPPIRILHLTAAPGRTIASFPRSLVVAGDGALVTLVEHFLGEDGAAALVAPVAEVVLCEGARVEHYRFQEDGLGAFHLGGLHVEQGAASRFSSHALELGARLCRSEVHARLAGEGGELALSGLGLADGARVTDAFALVEHAVPRCTSSETFKSVLAGSARGVFAGRVRVLPGAQKTSAYQSSSNLLLSEDATVDTKPQLEIFADDVKCGHGGTVGQLDETSLFYLRSRGLSEAAARTLLIYAFAAEMVERVRPEPLQARARALVAARLPEGTRLLEAA
ncbi:MAG TPA: Fe-S cluster assembly protein SufD [Anaeromyxobacteraceae bacterium]|nr:Fe-S cluster assembly protein SufD [Anaeromyxobacteraceae bacterium]